MTLLLGISRPEGIYMSADYRGSDARTGRRIDDSSVKFLFVQHPPDKGGPTSLLAYTGLAILPDGTPTGTWMRETLRGESEPFDKSMMHLGTRLDRDIARLGIPLIINVLVLDGERRYSGSFSNVETVQKKNVLRDSFAYHLQELEGSFVFASGVGAAQVIANQQLNLHRAQLGVRAQRPVDLMKLLATVNRRVAQRTRGVSQYCHVQFMNADDRTSPTSRTFLDRGETIPFELPSVLLGIDPSGMSRRFHDQLDAFFRGEVDDIKGAYLDSDAMSRELKRRS